MAIVFLCVFVVTINRKKYRELYCTLENKKKNDVPPGQAASVTINMMVVKNKQVIKRVILNLLL